MPEESPSETQKLQQLLQSEDFKKLVLNRWSFSLLLTLLMLTVYFGFIVTVAFNKAILARKIGAHISLGLPVGIGIILFAWLLTGIYVRWANTTYDTQVETLKNKLKK